MARFPTKATWMKETKARKYTTWPMLTVAANKYFPESDERQKGHRWQQHQGEWCRKEKHQKDTQLILHSPQKYTREISMVVEDKQHIFYTDQTGQLLVISSQGNWLLLVLCKTNGNVILVEPMNFSTSGKGAKHANISCNDLEAVT